MKCPWPSVDPDAVLDSVSIRSFSPGARAGTMLASSLSVAALHAPCAASMLTLATSPTTTARLIKMNDPPLDRGCDRLSPVRHCQLTQDIVQVRLHRSLRDE